MSDQLDRPARPPRRPRPAADAGVDPIDYRAAGRSAPTQRATSTDAHKTETALGGETERRVPAPPPASGPAVRDVTVQLNSRIAVDVAVVFDAASAQFPSKRAALEHAILSTFAPGGGAVESSGLG